MKAALLHRTLITSVVCTLPALSGLHAIEPLPVSVTAPADLRVVEGAAAGDLLFLLTSGGGSSTSFDVALTPGSEGALVALSQPDAEAPNGIRVDAAPSTPWTGALLLPGNAGTLTGQADLTGVTAGQTASFGVELSHADWNGTSTASTNINVVANRKLTGSATINAGRHMIGAEYTIGTLTLSGGSATDSEATRITVHENGYAQFSNGLRLSATTGHTFDGAEQTHDVQISYTGTSGNYTISNFTLPGSGQSSYTDASGNARHDFGGNWYTEAEYGNVFGETRTIIRQSGDWVWGSGSKTIHSYDLVETSQPTVQYSVYEGGHNWYLDRGAGVSMNERVGALISGENIAGSDLDLSGVVLNIEGTALEDRTLTGGVVDLGRKLVGAGTETIQRTDTVAITTSGADDHYTRLQVAAFNTGDGSLQAEHLAPADFVNASSTANVNLTANFEIDRSHLGHGSYTLDVGSFISSLENGGAGLAGENTQDYLAIGYQWTTVQNNALISSNLMVIEHEGLTGERSYGSGDAVKQAYLTSTHTDIGYYHNAIVLNDTYSVGVHDLGEVTAWATPEGLEGEDVSGISTTFKVVTATLHHAEMAEIEVTGALSSGALGDGSVLTLRNAGSSVYHASAFVDLENVRITGADQLQFQLDYQGPRDTGDFSERLLYSGESSTLAISYSGSDVAGEMTRVYRGGLSFDLYESIYGVVERISDHALGGEYYEFVGDPLYINSNYIRTETYQLEHRVEGSGAASASASVAAGSNFFTTGIGLTNSQENTSQKLSVATQAELIDSETLGDLQVNIAFTSLDAIDESVAAALTSSPSLSGILGAAPERPIVFGSDVLSLSGLDGTLHVLQMNYDGSLSEWEAAESVAQLLWSTNATVNGTPQVVWVNAVLGNSNIELNLADQTLFLNNVGLLNVAEYLASMRFEGSYTDYLSAFNLAAPELGAWGVDTVNNLVWAVIDHNSDFVTVVPEPGTYALLLFGGAAFYGLRLRNRKNS